MVRSTEGSNRGVPKLQAELSLYFSAEDPRTRILVGRLRQLGAILLALTPQESASPLAHGSWGRDPGEPYAWTVVSRRHSPPEEMIELGSLTEDGMLRAHLTKLADSTRLAAVGSGEYAEGTDTELLAALATHTNAVYEEVSAQSKSRSKIGR